MVNLWGKTVFSDLFVFESCGYKTNPDDHHDNPRFSFSVADNRPKLITYLPPPPPEFLFYFNFKKMEKRGGGPH
jgi:hypothetical protein